MEAPQNPGNVDGFQAVLFKVERNVLYARVFSVVLSGIVDFKEPYFLQGAAGSWPRGRHKLGTPSGSSALPVFCASVWFFLVL